MLRPHKRFRLSTCRGGTFVTALVIVGCGTNSPAQVEHDPPRPPNLFACYGGDPLDTHRCIPIKADELARWNSKGRTLIDRAWCFDAPARMQHDQFCFLSLDDCARRSRLDLFSDGPCVQKDARSARGGPWRTATLTPPDSSAVSPPNSGPKWFK